MIERFQPQLDRVLRAQRRCDLLEATGWLPHFTTPFSCLDELDGVDAGALDSMLRAHYRDNWASVRRAFEERLEGYTLDPEAKAAFSEALSAHGHGLYRACSRTVFPEIERVVRTELHAGMLGKGASQNELRKAVLALTLLDVEPSGVPAMVLFNKLIDHLYAHARSEGDVARLANEAVPNRHAALHGLVSYASDRSSVNALIMADFVFQVVCALKRDGASAPVQA